MFLLVIFISNGAALFIFNEILEILKLPSEFLTEFLRFLNPYPLKCYVFYGNFHSKLMNEPLSSVQRSIISRKMYIKKFY